MHRKHQEFQKKSFDVILKRLGWTYLEGIIKCKITRHIAILFRTGLHKTELLKKWKICWTGQISLKQYSGWCLEDLFLRKGSFSFFFGLLLEIFFQLLNIGSCHLDALIAAFTVERKSFLQIQKNINLQTFSKAQRLV